MKVVTVAQMRDLETRAGALGVSTNTLMEQAGLAVAQAVRAEVGGAAARRVLVLVGPGNNGGDGLVAARHLRDWGAEVRLYLLADRALDANLERTRQRDVPEVQTQQDPGGETLTAWLRWADVVLDAVLGTGRARPLEGTYRTVLTQVQAARSRRSDLRVVALDLPTGLDADTGGLDTAALHADLTVALGFPKLGLLTFPGAAAAGRLQVVDIGLPTGLADDITVGLLDRAWAAHALPQRPREAYKYTFGRVLAIGGSGNYLGAAALACQAAGRTGAGVVTLATAASLVPALAAKLTETTYLPLPESAPGHVGPDAVGPLLEALSRVDAIVLGCGIGLHPGTKEFVRRLLDQLPREHPPLLIDADALTIIAERPQWWEGLAGQVVLTPHSGEMARLLAATAAEVQSNRLAIAQTAAARWGATVVLKGAGTIIAAPDGRLCISPVATPALATAGTGDCLAGSIGAFLGQEVETCDAAALGVYFTGAAGLLVEAEIGPAGGQASDLLPRLPRVWHSLANSAAT